MLDTPELSSPPLLPPPLGTALAQRSQPSDRLQGPYDPRGMNGIPSSVQHYNGGIAGWGGIKRGASVRVREGRGLTMKRAGNRQGAGGQGTGGPVVYIQSRAGYMQGLVGFDVMGRHTCALSRGGDRAGDRGKWLCKIGRTSPVQSARAPGRRAAPSRWALGRGCTG